MLIGALAIQRLGALAIQRLGALRVFRPNGDDELGACDGCVHYRCEADRLYLYRTLHSGRFWWVIGELYSTRYAWRYYTRATSKLPALGARGPWYHLVDNIAVRATSTSFWTYRSTSHEVVGSIPSHARRVTYMHAHDHRMPFAPCNLQSAIRLCAWFTGVGASGDHVAHVRLRQIDTTRARWRRLRRPRRGDRQRRYRSGAKRQLCRAVLNVDAAPGARGRVNGIGGGGSGP